MSTFTLDVQIDQAQCDSLGSDNYSLCIAKCIAGDDGAPTANIVWSSTRVRPNTTFQWTNQYHVFGATNHGVGKIMEAETFPEPIQFGQICTLSGMSSVEAAPELDEGTFQVVNNYRATNIAISCPIAINGGDDVGGFGPPFYITPSQLQPQARLDLKPLDKVFLWFQKGAQSGTVLDIDTSQGLIVDLTDSTSQTVKYDDQGQWKIGIERSRGL